jgi:hypothetical protein
MELLRLSLVVRAALAPWALARVCDVYCIQARRASCSAQIGARCVDFAGVGMILLMNLWTLLDQVIFLVHTLFMNCA